MRLFYLSLPVWLLLSGCGRDRAESKADEPAATEQTTGPAKKAAEGAPATEAKPTEVRDIPRRVDVLVPKVVREDLVRQTVEFCMTAYEDVSREWLEERFAPYVEKARWTVTHNEGGSGLLGPVVTLKGAPPTQYISFPDGVAGKASSWSMRRRLPGSGDESVQTERAEKRAQAVFTRLVPSDTRSAYRLRKVHSHGLDRFTWRLELPGRRETAYTQVMVSRENGAVTSFRHYIERPIARGGAIKTRKEMESTVIEALGGVSPEYLKLFVARRIGRYEVWWQYDVPPEPEGGHEYTNWDAYTGELVSSNGVDTDGNRLRGARWYYNPKYHLQSEEEIIKRLEEVAEERAAELDSRSARVAELIGILRAKENVRGRSGRQFVNIESAARELGELGPDARSAVPILEGLLHDPRIYRHPPVGSAIVDALGQIGPAASAAVPRLREFMGPVGSDRGEVDGASYLCVGAAVAVWRITHDGELVFPYLAKVEGVINDREHAVGALGGIGEPAAPTLIALLRDEDGIRRVEAAKALGEIRPVNSETVDALAQAVHRGGGRPAAIALGRIGAEARAAVPALSKAAMARPGPDLFCAKAVWDITKDVNLSVPCIVNVLQHGYVEPDWGSVGPPDSEDEPDTYKPVNTRRIQAAALLGDIGPGATAALPALRGALEDPDPSVVSAARAAIERIDVLGKNAERQQDSAGPAASEDGLPSRGARFWPGYVVIVLLSACFGFLILHRVYRRR